MSLVYEKRKDGKLVARGDKEKYSSLMKTLGGKYNGRLKEGPGWILPSDKEEGLKNFLNSESKQIQNNEETALNDPISEDNFQDKVSDIPQQDLDKMEMLNSLKLNARSKKKQEQFFRSRSPKPRKYEISSDEEEEDKQLSDKESSYDDEDVYTKTIQYCKSFVEKKRYEENERKEYSDLYKKISKRS